MQLDLTQVRVLRFASRRSVGPPPGGLPSDQSVVNSHFSAGGLSPGLLKFLESDHCMDFVAFATS